MTLLRSPQRTRAKVPAHVVVFSNLSLQSKFQYTRFIIENQIKFERRPSDGKYVADVRLVRPTANIKENNQQQQQQHQSPQQQQQREKDYMEVEKEEEYMMTPEQQQKDQILRAYVPLYLHRYAKLIYLVGAKTYETTKHILDNPVKESKIIRLMHDIYNARYEEYLNTISTEEPQETVASGDEDSIEFATFVWQFLVKKFGLKKLIEQQTWQLIQGLHMRSHRLDVEMFSMFLQGMYTSSELNFFLKAKAITHKALLTVIPGVPPPRSSRSKKSTAASSTITATTWLSKAQFIGLAHLVFGTKRPSVKEDPSKMSNFVVVMQKAKAYIVTQNAGGGGASTKGSERIATRLFEVNEFLFLALETFHEAQVNKEKEQHIEKCPPPLPPPVSPPNNQIIPNPTLQKISKVTNIHHHQHPLPSASPSPPPPPTPPSTPPQRTMSSAASVRMMVTPRPPSQTFTPPPPPPYGPPPLRLQVQHSGTNQSVMVDDAVLSRVTSLLERMKTRQPAILPHVN